MEESEIRIGETYRCVAGWYRRPTKIEPSRTYSWIEVSYDLGRDKDCTKSSSTGPLPWFASKVIARVSP